MKYSILITSLLLIFFIFFVGLKKDPTIIPSNLISQKVSKFNLEPIKDFPLFSFDDLLGNNKKIKIVNFFASWCPPCKIEHPQLIKLSKKHNVYGIAKKDSEKNLAIWLDRLGNPFKKIGLDRNGLVSIEWGVYGLPETFIIDKDGIIRHKHIGPILKNDVKNLQLMIEGLE